MAKIMASYYNNYPMLIEGVKVKKPCKTYMSTLKFTDITVSNALIDSLITDSDLAERVIYDNNNLSNTFRITYLDRNSMPVVMKRCEHAINSLFHHYTTFTHSTTDKQQCDNIKRYISDISFIYNMIAKVYKASGMYYIEVIKDKT